jgi:hypothetical protein
MIAANLYISKNEKVGINGVEAINVFQDLTASLRLFF